MMKTIKKLEERYKDNDNYDYDEPREENYHFVFLVNVLRPQNCRQQSFMFILTLLQFLEVNLLLTPNPGPKKCTKSGNFH